MTRATILVLAVLTALTSTGCRAGDAVVRAGLDATGEGLKAAARGARAAEQERARRACIEEQARRAREAQPDLPPGSVVVVRGCPGDP